MLRMLPLVLLVGAALALGVVCLDDDDDGAATPSPTPTATSTPLPTGTPIVGSTATRVAYPFDPATVPTAQLGEPFPLPIGGVVRVSPAGFIRFEELLDDWRGLSLEEYGSVHIQLRVFSEDGTTPPQRVTVQLSVNAEGVEAELPRGTTLRVLQVAPQPFPDRPRTRQSTSYGWWYSQTA